MPHFKFFYDGKHNSFFNTHLIVYLYKIVFQEYAVINPYVIEGQTYNILSLQTGFWVQCSTSLLEISKCIWKSLGLDETLIPVIKFCFSQYLKMFYFIFSWTWNLIVHVLTKILSVLRWKDGSKLINITKFVWQITWQCTYYLPLCIVQLI